MAKRGARLVLGLLLALLCARPLSAAELTFVSGIVQVQSRRSDGWALIKTVPLALEPGDSVRTGYQAKATVSFDDGSRVELEGNASFTVESSDARRSVMRLNMGPLKAFVKRLGTRTFQVRTPTAVCSVRGTEFRVEVLGGGRTIVDLFKGQLGVEDNKGQQLLLRAGQRLEVDLLGMGDAGSVPTRRQAESSKFHAVMRRELTLDMSKEAVQAAAASELKLAELQQGKALIDVFGERVRLEEYIVRPRPDQFKLVVLNERASRFDYFYYLGTFNRELPRDLSLALRELSGTVGTAPTWWMTSFESGRSNTIDSAVEIGQGGHVVDVNSNADAADDVAFVFDAAAGQYRDATGRPVFQTIFDRYGFYLNGSLKYGWTGNDLQTYADAVGAALNDPITGAALPALLPVRSVTSTFPDPGQVRQVIYESYGDGTFIKWDNYIIDDEGRVASSADFSGQRAGRGYKEKLLGFNYEQVMTATEFGGRKIDLVVEPKILIQAGLIR